ncbi:hypothetical protein [Halomarina rubra]|uniref:NUDIX hydrolase n=1 Tax=Halomarina rubra TaxID=2071873 RepID=A0ABD6AWT8_9EURY|nr:hypothetical protein [Halomarina rubra]
MTRDPISTEPTSEPATEPATEEPPREPTDPFTSLDGLRDHERVAHERTERAFPDESFENLRRRYDAIAGVYQVGLTTPDGAVLLVGDDDWALPGGEVLAGEEWRAVARGELERLFGVEVALGGVLRLLDGEFTREGDAADRFVAPCVFFGASLQDPDDAFVTHPTFADDLDHPLYGDGSGFDIGWFDTVPDDANPNHVDDIESFLG